MSAENGPYGVKGGDFGRAGAVSIKVKKDLMALGLPRCVIRKVAVVVFEAEVNIISYADQGEIVYRVEDDQIVINIDDRGQGIPDVELALSEGFSTADEVVRGMGFGAGMGLPNMQRYSDEFQIDSKVDVGTSIRSVIYLKEGDKA